MKRKSIIIIGIVICLLLCIPGILWYREYQQTSTALSENIIDNETIMDEQNQTDSIETDLTVNEDSNSTESIESMDDIYNKVSELGQKAVDLENEYDKQAYLYDTDYDHTDEIFENIQMIQKNLEELFSDSRPVNQRWYAYDYDQVNPEWSFYADLDYSDSQIPVCWLCKYASEETEDLLAVVISQYDIESNMFLNSMVYETPYGAEYAPIDEWTEETEEYESEESISSNQFISGVKSIADALEQYTEPLVVEPGEIPYKYDEDEGETE